MINPVFAALLPFKQFILCQFTPGAKGKTNKFPVNPNTFQVANAHDPAIWVDYDTAESLSAADGYGIGFVFTNNDPFFFVDIDGCLVDGQWSDLATGILGLFGGASVEVSQSGAGLHVIGQYTGSAPAHRCKNIDLGLELYTEGRFVALTQDGAGGDAGAMMDAPLAQFIDQYMLPDESVVQEDWREQPVPEWSGPEDDAVLIGKMISVKPSAKASFGGGASIADLWECRVDALARAYPAIGEGEYDGSSADAALASHLAFWTGKNHARIERLMRQSKLMRDKWDGHRKYLPMTITNAVNGCQNVYNNGRMRPSATDELTPVVFGSNEATLTTGVQFIGAQQMLEHFKGCVYIQDIHRVFVPSGALLKPEQFRASFGGFEFSMVGDNSKTTKNAWEAFVEGQATRFPKVQSACFRPEIPSGSIIYEEGRWLVNTYVPAETCRVPGDVTPFLEHLSKTLPDERDRRIFLSYMAACVQYPGVKFQWCPLLQGVEGNGKTLFASVIAYSVGHRFTHFPNASDLGGNGSKFNGWIQNKLFIGVEEIYVSDRREVTEALKPLITNSRIEIQGKGSDQVTGDNRANFMMFTNHKDALIININGRRYCVFYSAQQTWQDCVRDGMGGEYFPWLYGWLRDGGYAAVNDYLRSYAIDAEFNPAGACHRAPSTTSTHEATELSMGSVEQEIIEAIEEGRPGFCGGWISSAALNRLLVAVKADRKVPPNRRRAMMQSLGYDYHPGLTNGRTNTIIAAEGTKPRIYIKDGHIHSNLSKPAVITDKFMEAQQYPKFDNLPQTHPSHTP